MTEDEFRDWIREWTLRFDKRHAEVMRKLDLLDEVVAENQAQRRALFKILDRLDRLDGGGATA